MKSKRPDQERRVAVIVERDRAYGRELCCGIADAANNLKREVEDPFGWGLEKVRAANEATWNDLLGRVKITTADRLEKKRTLGEVANGAVRGRRMARKGPGWNALHPDHGGGA